MATDPHVASSSPSTRAASPIENEIPNYRAISGWAIASLLLGALSGLAFANLAFVVASLGAIAAGAIALRSIRTHPDLLTGNGLANIGIALGLVTGLAASTLTFVRMTVIGQQARQFAEVYRQALVDGDLADVFYLHVPPDVREHNTPDEALSQIQDMPAGAPEDPRLASIQVILEHLKTSGSPHIHVAGVERRGMDGTTPVAHVRLAIEGAEGKDHAAEQYALIEIRAGTIDGRRDWWVEQLQFPYEAGSQAQVVESAHGHEH